MGAGSNSTHFTDIKSSDIDLNSEDCGNNMIVKAYPIGMIRANNDINVNIEDEGESRLEPYVGLEFDSADDAREFYSLYAMRAGFKIRTGQLYRSRVDGSVSNRRFVCSKEGFQLNSRTGCPAFVRVQKRDSGKWVVDQIQKEHNHELDPSGETLPTPLQQKTVATPLQQKTVAIPLQQKTHATPLRQKTLTATKSLADVSHSRKKTKLLSDVADGRLCPSGVISFKRVKRGGDEGHSIAEPHVGLEFNSANEAYQFYNDYGASTGFRIRIGQLFRSKLDGSITSRRFVCSKEGFQHPSRVGCGAFMRIKRQDSGRWVVDRHQMDHNHDLEPQTEAHKRTSASKKFIEDLTGGLEYADLVEINNGSLIKRSRVSNIGSDWYSVLFEYFQTRQAEDTGFFHAVEFDGGSCMSMFWADGRSRFSCSQFGDAIVFDTSYRLSNYSVPFATFIGVNHHKQPVLLGCALIADESKESFTWLFQTWLRAMSGRRPLSMIADQDKAIQQAIAQVFPGTHHRFSMWQFKAKEREYLSPMDNDFKFEYGRCIYQCQTAAEFDTAWNALLNKYGLRENPWLIEMYERRESWVPLYLRGTFFAGISLNEIMEPFFGTLLDVQTPLREFILRYERGLEQRREDERKEDFNSFNLQAFLQTNDPVEEQCRRLYTLAVFKIFQKELLQSYSYHGIKIYEGGTISRYSMRKRGNDTEKSIVTFSASNLNVSCSCQMFEFEGVLCRHVLKLFQMLDIREVPPHYILRRWTRDAEYGIVRDIESAGSSQDLKALMVWSLRETACKYIEAGATSLEKYKLAYEIMREGGRKLCWQR